MSDEAIARSRTIDAPPADVFAALCDPAVHRDMDPSDWDWVRDPVEGEAITRAGQVFGMNMFIEVAGGHYVMNNRVTVFEPDRAIAWEPGTYGDTGELEVGGWVWRYDLEPNGDSTTVTLTYDWAATPQATRDEIGGLPPFGPEYLEESLAGFDRVVRGHIGR